ncbi:MAG TPA: hypothetical protein VFQ70_01685 [Candidatus Saccharimonadaceae bacterium]|nr:hypothetical protein [Candidatus Saccharimonadaceae bacterium]
MEVLSVTVRVITMLAVVAAGVYSAFAARHATSQKMWLVAFLILVIGIIPFGIDQMLRVRISDTTLTTLIVAWITYFCGALLIVIGRLARHSRRSLTTTIDGSGAFIVALVLFGVTADWRVWDITQVSVRLLILVLLVGVSAGLVISLKKYRQRA